MNELGTRDRTGWLSDRHGLDVRRAPVHTSGMTNPYSVPMEDLDAVHVPGAELIEERQLADLRWAAGVALVHPFGDGATPDAVGE
ncbi:MAG: hypothetical protein WD794_15155 [Mycobacteriales bacterium]